MKIALAGYGNMGRVVEEVAAARGVEVVGRFTRQHPLRAQSGAGLDGATVIDFSVPEAVPDTARAAAELALPLVIGTTGWHDRLDEVRGIVESSGIGAVQAANFSLGVNVFYRLAEQAAKMLAAFEYDPFILDWHHRFKKDSPSGTALEIRRRMARYYSGDGEREVPISCQRAGYVPSEHSVGFDSQADTIHLQHRARNRRGFAEGALLAAGWIAGRRGFHDFQEALDDILPAG
jgi:4-hydroxy-tetrahydrodipicolinate reductase